MTSLVERCDGCRFSRPASTTFGMLFCRRYPPVIGTAPLVGPEEWCGEWEERPELLSLTTTGRAEMKT